MLTNTVVLGAVRDEVGWVGWLYSIGNSEGRVVWLGRGCSDCLWGVECSNEEGGSRAKGGPSPSPHQAHQPHSKGQDGADLCSGRMGILGGAWWHSVCSRVVVQLQDVESFPSIATRWPQ